MRDLMLAICSVKCSGAICRKINFSIQLSDNELLMTAVSWICTRSTIIFITLSITQLAAYINTAMAATIFCFYHVSSNLC